jgi:alpha-L-fucosidase 2
MDMQILRDLFDQTVAAADIPGVDPGFVTHIKNLQARLAPDKIGTGGQLQEWLSDWNADAPEP